MATKIARIYWDPDCGPAWWLQWFEDGREHGSSMFGEADQDPKDLVRQAADYLHEPFLVNVMHSAASVSSYIQCWALISRGRVVTHSEIFPAEAQRWPEEVGA